MFKEFFGGKNGKDLQEQEAVTNLRETVAKEWAEHEQKAHEKAKQIFDKEMTQARMGTWRSNISKLKDGYIDGISIPESKAQLEVLRATTLKALEYAFNEEMKQIQAGTWGSSSFLLGTQGSSDKIEQFVVNCKRRLDIAAYEARFIKQKTDDKTKLEKERQERERILHDISIKLAEESELAEQGKWNIEKSYFMNYPRYLYPGDLEDKVKVAASQAREQLEKIKQRKDAEGMDFEGPRSHTNPFGNQFEDMKDVFARAKRSGTFDPFGRSDDFGEAFSEFDPNEAWNPYSQRDEGAKREEAAQGNDQTSRKHDTSEFFQGKTTPQQDIINALKILGLNSNATAEEAKAAHRRFMKIHSQRTPEASSDTTTQDLVSVLGRVKPNRYDEYLRKANNPETETV